MQSVTTHLRLGVNIDHVATLRNARGGSAPDPLRAARIVVQAGADGVTAHLREDRRHISDDDIRRLKTEIDLPLNMEMAATEEMVALALKHRPHAACIVPERREEVTTEGGLDVVRHAPRVRGAVERLAGAGIRVSLFVDPDEAQLRATADAGAAAVELHTGDYANARAPAAIAAELDRLRAAARTAAGLGLEVHAGHGLTVANVGPVAAIPEIVELNIGHSIVGRAILVGMAAAVREMKDAIARARA